MKIYLSPHSRIWDIKKKFENSLPYLKLEFFKKKHTFQQGNERKDMVPNNATLIEVTDKMKSGEIEFTTWQTVAEVEQLFQSKFNLQVQIFRKTRYSALETIKTDYLTLEKQNKMGREACHEMYDEVALL
ncbi:MAG: hypothetical protein ACXWCZ_09440 [Flavisolibacter sp.]